MSEKITTCVTCQKKIPYKTKKPKWCKPCKKKQPKVYRKPKRRIPKHSKKERKMQYLLNTIFTRAGYIDGGYYSFILSPKGSPLQLDRYYPKLKLAFEYDGAQHATYNSFMHKSKEAFDYLQVCDTIKNETCKKFGIRLIRIPHNAPLTHEYIIQRLKNLRIYTEMREHIE